VPSSDKPCPSVPTRYADATLPGYRPGTPEQRTALAAAEATLTSLAAGDRASLVLLGSPGVGKSHLAAAICHEEAVRLMRRWDEETESAATAYRTMMDRWDGGGTWNDRPRMRRVPQPDLPRWVNVPSLLVDVKAEFALSTDDQERTRFARSLRSRAGLVVLDDLGRERISEWTGELVYVIVNDRYEAGLPTIATSNLTVEELVSAGYWPAISRLAQDGRLVEIKGPDQRLRRAS
jgi:DNA replication protein DnaC